jgi:radical SAM/Cys-rich protein
VLLKDEPDIAAGSVGAAADEGVTTAREAASVADANFDSYARDALGTGLVRGAATTLQVNITKRCNLACHHCHVESGPKRSEAVSEKIANRVLELLERNPSLEVLDLTGGAPELSGQFRRLVTGARALGRRVIDRCNLTILYEPGQEDTAAFLAENRVDVVASLPCYTAENVEAQRGRGVFDKSIEGLRWLVELGYGDPGGDLVLDLVYNPGGAFLPPAQAELEATYRDRLAGNFGIRFNRLLTITNMPIKRFAHDLEREGRHGEYMSLLVNHFNPDTVAGLMCRETISVGHDGQLYDCDFNQQLELGMTGPASSIFDFHDAAALTGQRVATAAHCFGCTAGAGSSCGGALD